ncbi:immunoglobulin kappa light chain-like isoform X2 [Larimichthys crocea]|uniref:immunoglobulin kappa light chain-like isoform X2 n=1 Tax=Larimichthys crocea TaxID=215358 RepID=UPI000900C186|nr:immunoglobulin kappa light chain-like isoform X2 [Larimichthys crocea]
MTSAKFVVFLTCLLFGKMAWMKNLKSSSTVRQERLFVSAKAGDNVSLKCFSEDDESSWLYWYKQTLGEEPRLISTLYVYESKTTFYHEFSNNPRFSIENYTNRLIISDLTISDSATYFCASTHAFAVNFSEGITVSVKGSGLNIPALVHQSASETIQPGGSVTLNCTVHTGTCDGEHSVYWFKDSEESHPGLIYTHGGRNDQCERKPNTQTHTCVYNLPMKSLNLSHAGTYYCAVASCGHILFGNGTKLDFEDDKDSLVSVYVLSGAFSTILVILLAYTAYTTKTCQCTDSPERSSASSAPNAECYQDAENLHYAALRTNKVNRSARRRDVTWSECVYTRVRQ